MVTLSGKDRQLNEFSITRLQDEPSVPKHDLVMLHGYGAGLAFFYKNFESLSRRPGWRLFALDLPGMGRSSRPPFKIHAKDRQGKIEEAESWFVDALEEWRVKRKLEKFTLLGHSLGGYMAVAYALKYPGRLEKLILASPVGIPEDPWAMKAEMPDSGATGSSANLTKGKGDVIEDANVGAAPAPPKDDDDNHKDQNNFLNARKEAEAKAGNGKTEAGNPRTRPYPKWLVYLWDANVSPFSFIRWAGPLGPRLVSGWTSRRFSHLPPDEAESLHHYSYSLFRQRGSGEYALAHILAPGAFARSPLIRRIGEVGRGYVPDSPANANGSTTVSSTMGHDASSSTALSTKDQQVSKKRENGIPVVFLYGEHDWMDVKGGHAAVRKLQEARKKAIEGKSAEEAAKDKGDARIYVIRSAGHHVYLDGPDEFNEVMAKEMEDTEKRAQ
jgi:cardiolipin-specific phospholipase